jgi:hypothetical protein
MILVRAQSTEPAMLARILSPSTVRVWFANQNC